MNNKFDRNLLLKNIHLLCKRRNIKISELEKKLKVSKGYLSRLKKSDLFPTIDLIINLSTSLDIETDVLLNIDLSSYNDNEILTYKFINKLFSETVSYKIFWKTYYNFGIDKKYKENPGFRSEIFVCECAEDIFYKKLYDFTEMRINYSICEICGNIYETNIHSNENDNVFIYLVLLKCNTGKINDNGLIDYENRINIYIKPEKETTASYLCCDKYVNNDTQLKIVALLNFIEEKKRNLDFNPLLRNYMKNYLEN